MSKEECQAARFLAVDRSTLKKKGSCIVVWYKNDYLLAVERQLSDTKVYRHISNTENVLSKLWKASNRMFNSHKRRGFLTEKQMKYFN